MEPVSEKRTVIDHVLYKVDVWVKGEQVELSARSRFALQTLINDNLSYDSFGRIAVGEIYRDVIDTETDIEGEIMNAFDSATGRSKIAAIKRYRELTGLGLKDSKDAVEEILERHGVKSKIEAYLVR